MLSLTIVEEIGRLLGEGQLSRRKIARKLSVSRSTVCAIASGQRALYGKQSEPDAPNPELLPPERCPKCGYLVEMPCLVCRAREYRHGRRDLAALSGQRSPTPRRPHRPPERCRGSYQARVA
jgi:hypothetical protein